MHGKEKWKWNLKTAEKTVQFNFFFFSARAQFHQINHEIKMMKWNGGALDKLDGWWQKKKKEKKKEETILAKTQRETLPQQQF